MGNFGDVAANFSVTGFPQACRAATISGATPTFAVTSTDAFDINQSSPVINQAITIAAPSAGTPTEGQRLTLRLLDDGSSHNLSYNSIYQASTNVTLPTTTIGSTTVSMVLVFQWDSSQSKWMLITKRN